VLADGGCSDIFFSFRTVIHSQVYEVELDLYGPIHASSIIYTAKGFFVHIKMMKIVTGKMV
jgi:hypothetical protein